MLRLIALLAIGLAQATPIRPSKFDLLCDGSFRSGARKRIPVSFRYVVDLDRMLWCKNDVGLIACPKVSPIVRVDDSRYTFRESKPNELSLFDYVDRQTGSSSSYDRQLGFLQDGLCRIAPFSGFPIPKL